MRNIGVNPDRIDLSTRNFTAQCRAGEYNRPQYNKYFGTPIYTKQIWTPHARSNSLLLDNGSYSMRRSIGVPVPGYLGHYATRQANISPVGQTFGHWTKTAAHRSLMDRYRREMQLDGHNIYNDPMLDERRRRWTTSEKNVLQTMPFVRQSPGGVTVTSDVNTATGHKTPRQLTLDQFGDQILQNRYAWQDPLHLRLPVASMNNLPSPIDRPSCNGAVVTANKNFAAHNVEHTPCNGCNTVQMGQTVPGTSDVSKYDPLGRNDSAYRRGENNSLFVPPHMLGVRSHAMRPLSHTTTSMSARH